MPVTPIFKKTILFLLCLAVCGDAYAAGKDPVKTVKRVVASAPIERVAEQDPNKKRLSAVELLFSESVREAQSLDAEIKVRDARLKEKDLLLAKQTSEAQKLKEQVTVLRSEIKIAKDSSKKNADTVRETKDLMMKAMAKSAADLTAAATSPEYLLGAMLISNAEPIQLSGVGLVTMATPSAENYFLLDQDQFSKFDKMVARKAVIKKIGKKDGKIVVGINGNHFEEIKGVQTAKK